MKTSNGLEVSKDLLDELADIKEFVYCRGKYNVSYYDEVGNCIDSMPVPLQQMFRDAFCYTYIKDGRERVGFDVDDFDKQEFVDLVYQFKHPNPTYTTVLTDSFTSVKITL